MTDSPSDDAAITQLDDQTVQRIAAGEVVERPASVVKELIENSLDAGATRIAVAIDGGGTDHIRVRDNGHGIPESELSLAVAEHATSKISDIDDLDAGVGTLGFRGEALATIGAVSRLTVRSRPADADSGAELTVDGGDVGAIEPAGCPVGTTVEVEELFFNTPARRKFLSRDRTEFDHVNTVVSQYALANPDVAVAFEHDGREVFATEGTGSLRSAVLAVYGRDVAESMIEVDYETDDGPIERISGLISDPETTRSTRSYLATFVNDRYVTASLLRGAVVDAYGGQLAPDRYPFAVLFVDVPPGSVDVNVHPRKTEVRFDDEAAVGAAVGEAVADALLEEGLIRSSAPRGRSAPEETAIEPEPPDTTAVGGGDRDTADDTGATGDVDTERSPANGEIPAPDADPAADAASRSESTPTAQADGADAAEPVDPSAADGWVVDDIATESTPTGSSEPTDPVTAADSSTADGRSTTDGSATADTDTVTTPTDSSAVSTPTERTETDSDDTVASHPTPDPQRFEPTQPTTQQTLTGETTTAAREYDTLPTLRVLGQLYDTYLLAATDNGLVLIDQHAADERVNYERLQAELAERPATQTLAEPVSLELTAREAALFESVADQLAAIGFRAEDAGDRTVTVTGVPAVFATTLEPEFLREALLGVVDAAEGDGPLEAAIDELLADLACHPSVTGNTSLTEGSVVELLSALDDCENPYACPHGRPVLIEITREEIADRFERDYPGHGRRPE